MSYWKNYEKNTLSYCGAYVDPTKDKKIVKFVNGKLTAMKTGKTSIIVQLKDYPEIHKEIEVNIGSEPEFNAYINGDAVIKLDRQATYEFIANSNSSIGLPFVAVLKLTSVPKL